MQRRRLVALLVVAALGLGAGVLVLWGRNRDNGADERRAREASYARRLAEAEAQRRRLEGDEGPRDDPPRAVLTAQAVSLSPDGRWLLVSYGATNRQNAFGPLRSLSLWDTQTGKELWGICDGLPRLRLLWLPGGKHFLARGPKGRPALWDAGRGVPVRDFGKGSEEEVPLAVSADGRRALASAGGELRVCALPSGETIAYLGVANGTAIHGSLSPDGKWVVASFGAYLGSNSMALWEVAKGLQPRRVWAGSSGWGGGAGFSPDGKFILVGLRVTQGGEKFYSVLLERDSGKELWRAEGGGAQGFSPDGKQVFGARIVPWQRQVLGRLDAATGKQLWSSEPLPEGVTWVCFSADGRRSAAAWGFQLEDQACPGITVGVWDATTGKSLRQWRVPEELPQRQLKP
jgi:WD40 repeat protein